MKPTAVEMNDEGKLLFDKSTEDRNDGTMVEKFRVAIRV
jgi:hypothetical protein